MADAYRVTVSGTDHEVFTELVGQAVVFNTDATNTVYLGAAGVTAATGFPLAAGASLSLQAVDSETLWGITGGASVVLAVMLLAGG